ncbi:MAG TPA: hypothetical protein VLN59_16360 [Burkholderiales bacterium]|nr:hypothetical protein [Burkholderiales bacterium]
MAVALTVDSASAEQMTEPHSVTTPLATVALADLEDAFWLCDYTATTHGSARNDITLCTAVYDVVKERKFGGDFDKLLDWWRENKITRHKALAADDAERAPR